MLQDELADLYARDLTRLLQELRAFPDTASLWKTLPGVTNSAGNLALHLEGNLREYIGRQVGKIDYTRDRPLEFSRRDVELEEVVRRIEAVKEMVPTVLRGVTAPQFDAMYPEQVMGHPMTTRLFLVHLLGHLHWHLGQIDYLRRITTGQGAVKLATLQ